MSLLTSEEQLDTYAANWPASGYVGLVEAGAKAQLAKVIGEIEELFSKSLQERRGPTFFEADMWVWLKAAKAVLS